MGFLHWTVDDLNFTNQILNLTQNYPHILPVTAIKVN